MWAESAPSMIFFHRTTKEAAHGVELNGFPLIFITANQPEEYYA
jgi:hypothetical protein